MYSAGQGSSQGPPRVKGKGRQDDHSMGGVSRSHHKKSMYDERDCGDHLSGGICYSKGGGGSASVLRVTGCEGGECDRK